MSTKKEEMRMKQRFLLLMLSLSILSGFQIVSAQKSKWLRVGEVQSPFNELGSEFEGEFTAGNGNFFAWQPQFGIDQNVSRSKGLWIGCKNFNDPVEKKIKSVKVIGAGHMAAADPYQIFPQEIKLIGKYRHPTVSVDDASASTIDTYDALDEVDPNLPCDRMIIIKFNTSTGISVTKKIMAFSQSNHGNYFIYDYVFKNTGIIDQAGTVQQQALDSVWFYFTYRYGFGGVGARWSSTWTIQSALWGASNLYHAFGENPTASVFNDNTSLFYMLRGFYSYYSPVLSDPEGLTYAEAWGSPNTAENGEMACAKYAGCVTLHADMGPQNQTDDLYQPRTTWYLGSDIDIVHVPAPSQYDEIFMADRWAAMTEGHPAQQWDEVVPAGSYVEGMAVNRKHSAGGVLMGQGYGPYQLASGDSIHIVFAEGVSGIGWEKGREVGANWLQWKKGTGTPTLTMPDGSPAPDRDTYKKAWIFSGRDSLLRTFRNAKNNFNNSYSVPQAPPPPSEFTVASGGDRIQLTWANNASTASHFGGYVIYRSEGNVLNWTTVYNKIFETNDPTIASYSDTSAKRGFDYFYYIQSKDDGTQIPGTTLYSSLFWTLTNTGAVLGRPAGSALQQVRVVPNPYDIRGRFFQFGDQSQYDRMTFYGLPPLCKLKIFTENGELIWEMNHTRTTGDEVWDSKTSSGQIIVSGIYILYVEVTQDTYDTWINKDNRLLYRKGDSVFRKFVVIR
jgi:hypothetical protein